MISVNSISVTNGVTKSINAKKVAAFGNYASNTTSICRETAKILPGAIIGIFEPKLGFSIIAATKVISDFLGFCLYTYKSHENLSTKISKLNFVKRINDKTQWFIKNQPSKTNRLTNFLKSY